ncbi:MAG: DUF4292 domain-containing protein [Candidatus Latescibacterota bacterium]
MSVRIAVLGAVLLLACGCASLRPLGSGWTVELGLDSLLALPAARFERLGDLQAEARITVRDGKVHQRATALIQVRNPDLLRLEVRGGPLLSHVFTALQRGDSLYVHAPQAGGSLKGEVRGPLLFALTGVDLGGYDLRYALFGIVEPGAVDSTQLLPPARRGVAVVPVTGTRRRQVWVDLRRGLVTGEDLLQADGRPLLQRRLCEYRRTGGVLLPQRVEIHQGGRVLVVEYRSLAVDRGLAARTLLRGLPLDRMQPVDLPADPAVQD